MNYTNTIINRSTLIFIINNISLNRFLSYHFKISFTIKSNINYTIVNNFLLVSFGPFDESSEQIGFLRRKEVCWTCLGPITSFLSLRPCSRGVDIQKLAFMTQCLLCITPLPGSSFVTRNWCHHV